MAGVRVNTAIVEKTSDLLKNKNVQIQNGFPNVEKAISKLDSKWDGQAATRAIGKFYEIKNSSYESRYNAMDNYVRFLYEQVGMGYEQTESVNTALAAAFK